VNLKKSFIGILSTGCVLAALHYAVPVVLASAAAQGETAVKTTGEAGKDGASGAAQPINATRAAREEKALQDARRQQLSEKEAALAVKEQELKKLSAKLEAQVKALEESKKRLDDSLKVKSDTEKKKQDEKVQKMVKLFKTMKGEQAGKMIDSLKEELALSLLSRMDTKTVAKLAPFISQPRIIKWVSDNLQDKLH
jgi:flagellar motility protein MotE (MotC chaperone)